MVGALDNLDYNHSFHGTGISVFHCRDPIFINPSLMGPIFLFQKNIVMS